MARVSSGKILYFSGAGFIPIFLLIVFYGYYASFRTSYPEMPYLFALLYGAVPVVFLTYLMRIYAYLKIDAHNDGTFEGNNRGLLIKIIFILVLSVSAGGVITASTLMFEGPAILRENVDVAHHRATYLAAEAQGLLAMPKYEQVVSEVRSLQSAMNAEIKNSRACGMGEKAKETFYKIQKHLPNIQLLNTGQSSPRCTDATALDRICADYDAQITQNLLLHPDAVNGRYQDRKALLSKIDEKFVPYMDTLKERLTDLSGIRTLLFNIRLYADVLGDLVRVNGDYVELRSKIISFEKRGEIIPPDIGHQDSINVVRPLAVFGVLAKRWDVASTYVYGFLSILLDFIMLIILEHLVRQNRKRVGMIGLNNQAANFDGSQVVLLTGPGSQRSVS